jgi:hypothetical protein
LVLARKLHVERLRPTWLVLPFACYVLSLLIGFVQVLMYRGTHFVLGDLAGGLKAYETLVSAQRKQLILPLLFLMAGIAFSVVVFVKLR